MKNNGEILSDKVQEKSNLEKNSWCVMALFSALNPKNICNNIRAKKEEKRQKREQEEQERKEKALKEAAERKEKALKKAAERKKRYREYKAFIDSEIANSKIGFIPIYGDSKICGIRCFIEELLEIENTSYDPYDVTEEYDSLEQKKQWKLKDCKGVWKDYWWLHIESLQCLYGNYENYCGSVSWWAFEYGDLDIYSYRFPSNIINLLKKYWFTYGLSES